MMFYAKTNTCCGSVQNKHQHMVLYAISSQWWDEQLEEEESLPEMQPLQS
jgi:hypothetical protein